MVWRASTVAAWTLLAMGCQQRGLEFTVEGEAAEQLVGVPNIDDDDGNDRPDWRAMAVDEEGTRFTLSEATLKRGKGNAQLQLTLDDPSGRVRVWHGGEMILHADALSWSVPESEEALTFEVEFGAPALYGRLALVALDKRGEEVERAWLQLRSAPVVLNHHLQPTERSWHMDVQDGRFYNNQHMVQTYADVLGDAMTFVDPWQLDFDVWVQDEMQLATLTRPSGQLEYVLDSIRDGGLDPLPKSLTGPDVARGTHGRWIDANTFDSFGNLEVSPPVEVDGVAYPYGRIYVGNYDGYGPHQDLLDFLDAQKIQAPVSLDTSWLCVGHVDEYMSFLPDPDAPKGFRVALADTVSAWEILDGMDASTQLPRYARNSIELGHGRDTVGDITGDSALRMLNDDVQRDNLDAIKAQLKRDFGLTDEDFIAFPTIFEEAYDCFGTVVALTPGMVNLFLADAGGQTHAFMADPFMRDSESTETQADDPFIRAVTERLPSQLVPHFVDDWFVFHMGMGEVHCGTNAQRTQTGQWWNDAMHLMED